MVAAFGIMVVGMLVTPMAASAAPNPNIVVSDIELTTPDGGQATVGDPITMTGKWDASAADPQGGDTFTFTLPEELGFEGNVPFELKGGDGGNEVWGNCLTNDPSEGTATCTLTDLVENKAEVKGDFGLQLEAIKATTEEEVTFDLNGDPVSVDLPGEGGIDDGLEVDNTFKKSGAQNSNKWSMGWTIELGGNRLVGQDTVTIGEQLSDNHKLCEPSKLKVEPAGTVEHQDEVGEGAFSIVLTAPDGGFDPKVKYSITYDTCTLDEEIDPVDTEYTNEATVGDDSTGEIGVTQDWEPSGKVSKSGSVLGGENRRGVIEWTVTVAGDHLADPNGTSKDSFTLSEVLGEAHELCTDDGGDVYVRDLRVTERYGPSEALVTTLDTDVLERQTLSATADGFEVKFTIADGEDFEFKPSPYLYKITYKTCASQDGIPPSGTEFTNSATVDGTTSGSSTKVPGRTKGKTGNINTSSVTLDGQTYLPQTTLGWEVRLPGEELSAVDSDLTVTDTLTGDHEVCGTGDDIPARLGLRVRAVDQISDGGLATADLTEGVTATFDGDDITLTIPEPTLPQPGGGEAAGFSPEYRYMIDYTTCTTSGGMDAPGTEYGNNVVGTGFTFGETIEQRNSAGGTGQGVSQGSVSVSKELDETSPGAGFVPDGTMFTVHVKEFAPAGDLVTEYDLDVPLDGTAEGLNPRGNGWTVELSEPTFPDVSGVKFGDPVFAATDGVTPSEDGTTATAELTPGTNIAVELTNSAELGSLEVTKVIEGPAADLVDGDREFSVTADIDVSGLGEDFPDQDDREFKISADAGFTLDDLPIGATVSFTETQPDDDDTFTWGDAVIDPDSIEVEPGHASEPGVVTVTNTVDRTVGTFTLAKNVTGAEADNPAVPDEVTVTATWDEEGTPGEKTLTLPVDGTLVDFGEDLLIGTEVTLTETTLDDGSGIAWGAPVWSGTGVAIDDLSAVVTIGTDGDAQVNLENHAATSTAGISLLKGIAGEAAGEVDPDTEFPVTATWTDADENEQSKDLLINAVTPTSLGEDLPAGTEVTLTEGDLPEFSTVDWASITISGTGVEDNGDGSATVVVSDQQSDTTLVTVTNEATWAPGTFSVTKEVTGVHLEHPDVPEIVTVTATWFDGEVEQSKEMTIPTDGTVVPFGDDLPHETAITLTETPLENSQSFAWDAPVWEADNLTAGEGDSAVVTIGAATTMAVSLTNNATVVLGSIDLVKELTGTGASATPSDAVFPVTASWTDLEGNAQEQNVDLSAGTPVTIDDLPLGVEVHLTEHEANLPDDLQWKGAEWAGTGENVTVVVQDESTETVVTVVGESGETAAVSLTNEIEKLPDLPSTGANLGPWQLAGLVGAGLLFLGGGAGMLYLRGRRA